MSHKGKDGVSYLACTNFRHKNKQFGIKQSDRLSHLYIIGKTGVGKTTLIETLASQDLSAGRGFALIDPHGDLAENIAANTSARVTRGPTCSKMSGVTSDAAANCDSTLAAVAPSAMLARKIRGHPKGKGCGYAALGQKQRQYRRTTAHETLPKLADPWKARCLKTVISHWFY